MGRPVSNTLTWFCVRRNGVARGNGWLQDVALEDLRKYVNARPGDTVEVSVVDEFTRVNTAQFPRVFSNRVRGIIGMEASYRGKVVRYAPTRMIASNFSFKRALESFFERRGIGFDEFSINGELRSFTARQFLLPDPKKGKPVSLFRGSTLVEPMPEDMPGCARALASGIGRWLMQNMSSDGSLPYKYWPSQGKNSPADNAIRRFLGTLSLARLGALQQDQAMSNAAQRNLRFNLGRYFKDLGDGRGAIVEEAGAKLGAAALAGLAILECPDQEEFSRELVMLAAGIESLADNRLGFRTFFFPAERDGDNWNFYSGEALLFWAEALRRGMSFAPPIERCATVSECCRKIHRKKRNPAFVPWHTQACASLFAHTGRREFARFALDISDWLLPMQQWDISPADLPGRFYNPSRPDFGPPHAASTGAYMEGLTDAAALARALGEDVRLGAYEQALHRGLRSLRQLQFHGQHDTYYISKKNRVLGALRTEVYDNAVRLDSAAHALLASIKILQPMEFNLPQHEAGGMGGVLRDTISFLRAGRRS
ncbi:MAG: hypothetical protein OXG06_00065 [Gammaproteobacteria bacterium]|nr:hypothetical protein [Gammaproteobacteria bacterium]